MGRTYHKKKKQYRKKTSKKRAIIVKPHGNMRGGVIYARNKQNQYQPVTSEDIKWFIENSVTDLVSNDSLRSCVFKITLKNGITSNLYDDSTKEIKGLVVKLVFHSTERVNFEIAGTKKVSEFDETNRLEFENQKKIDDLFTNINIVPQVAVYIPDQNTVHDLLNQILNKASTSIDDEFFYVIDDIIKISRTPQTVSLQRQNGIFGTFFQNKISTTPVELSMMIMEYIPEKYEDLYNFRYEVIKNKKLPIYESICQFIVACLIIIRERLNIINVDLHTGNILIDSELINQRVPIPPHELFEKIKIIDWGAVKNVTDIITPVDTNTYIFNTMKQMVHENMYDGGYSQMKWLCSLLFKIIHTPIDGTVTTGNNTETLWSDAAKMEDQLQKLRNELKEINVDWINLHSNNSDLETNKNYEKYKNIMNEMNQISHKLTKFESDSVVRFTTILEDPDYDNNDIIVVKLREFCEQVRFYKNAIEKQIYSPPSKKKTQQINQENNIRKKARV